MNHLSSSPATSSSFVDHQPSNHQSSVIDDDDDDDDIDIDAFQESVRRFYVALAELQASDRDEPLSRVYDELGAMRAEIYVASGAEPQVGWLIALLLWVLPTISLLKYIPPITQPVQEEMLSDCERKAGDALLNRLRKATSAISPDPIAAPILFYECARLKQEAKVIGCH